MFRGVRGATTVNDDNEIEIVQATEILLRKMIEENEIEAEKVASVFISVTEDITAVFPAKAMRLIEGWKYVPVMCMKEIPVASSLPKCIRVMIHVNTNIPQKEISHIYLGEAISLRPDLNTVDQS
ncbi:chorismate mutase [Cytobacillus dafuensis]|uniref:chorismate mutase n=1 Tax=Cytobacillus dafuensis TaxID=1742359 RepID=A0A5B8Z650_CYTDA|nr:chorismate mutase [Cytobacillus dafuensis]QED48431.1 chorismate mutase [Cytobacillus dafuensis]